MAVTHEMLIRPLGGDLQQLSVEDSQHTRALQAVGGRAALPLLEDVGQLLNLIPLAQVLQGGGGHTEIRA